LAVCKKLKNFDTVISTDNNRIKTVCAQQGFRKIHNRSKLLSRDNTSMIDLILDYLKSLSVMELKKYKNLILLQPTSPLRTYRDVLKLINIFNRRKLVSLASISKVREHPYECVETKGNKWEYIKTPKKKSNMSQTYKKNFFFIDGSIYINSFIFLKKYKSLIVKNKTKLIKANNNFAVDIDEYHDLSLASYYLKKEKK
jgi:CMP-N-acetylneuraminic acid synthetase